MMIIQQLNDKKLVYFINRFKFNFCRVYILDGRTLKRYQRNKCAEGREKEGEIMQQEQIMMKEGAYKQQKGQGSRIKFEKYAQLKSQHIIISQSNYIEKQGPIYFKRDNIFKAQALCIEKSNIIWGKKMMMEKYPTPPKKALSAFFLYRAEVYDKVKAQNPNSKITELTKIISQMWGNVDAETKTRLEAEYEKNKAQVAKEKEEYEEKYGKIQRKKHKKIKKNKKGEDNDS